MTGMSGEHKLVLRQGLLGVALVVNLRASWDFTGDPSYWTEPESMFHLLTGQPTQRSCPSGSQQFPTVEAAHCFTSSKAVCLVSGEFSFQ